MNRVPLVDLVEVSGHESGREPRLRRVLTVLEVYRDACPLLDCIRSLHDHKGVLTVTVDIGHEIQRLKDLCATAWELEYEYSVEFKITGWEKEVPDPNKPSYIAGPFYQKDKKASPPEDK